MKVFVTGAGGFIGSHLVDLLLKKGYLVRALVRYNSHAGWGHLDEIDPDRRERLEVCLGDVTDPYLIRDLVSGCEVVFHLAALIGIPYSYHAPSSYVATNLGGTLNILEACRQARSRRVIVTSTSEVYGTARYTPIDEAHPLHAQSPYAAKKRRNSTLSEWRIPFFEPDLGEAELEAVTRVIRSKWLTMGEVTAEFESRFTELVGCRHAGTDHA